MRVPEILRRFPPHGPQELTVLRRYCVDWYGSPENTHCG